MDNIEIFEALGIQRPSPVVVDAASYLDPNSKILDLGAGEAKNSIYLASLGHDVQAVEIDPGFVEVAEELARRVGNMVSTLAITRADIMHIQPAEKLDAVICTAVLQYLGSREAVYNILERMVNTTAPNGINVISVPIAIPEDKNLRMSRGEYVFKAEEIAQFYEQKDWLVDSETQVINVVHNGQEDRLAAVDRVIAMNRANKVRAEQFSKISDQFRHDPELSEFYLQQAGLLK